MYSISRLTALERRVSPQWRDILDRQILQLGDAIDQLGDRRAEFDTQRFDRDIAVFGDIVQQAGRDRLGIHLHFRQDAGDGDAMSEIGFARFSLLPGMGALGAVKSRGDQVHLVRFDIGQRLSRASRSRE